MTKQVYKTAQGKTVDMGALRLQNENVRAVGNDEGRVISTKVEQVNNQYNKQIQNNQG